MKSLRYLLLGVNFIAASASQGQDIHLSQYYDSPLSINPAATGAFPGDYRLATNYKSQWKTISSPYKTIAASADAKVHRFGVSKKSYAAAGISLFRDKAGKSNMGLTQVSFNAAYQQALSDHSSLAVGVQPSFAQRSLNTTDLKWDSQWDGNNYDPTLPPEYGYNQNFIYFDIGTGVEYKYYNSQNKFKYILGVSSFHLHQPKQRYYPEIDRLYRKYMGYTSAHIPLPKKPFIIIVPQLMYSMQGPYREILAGGQVRYVFGADMSDDNVVLNTYTLLSSAVQAGILYRFKDAIVATASFEMHKSLSIGISYDLNISKLKVASELRGGMELSLVYKGFLPK